MQTILETTFEIMWLFAEEKVCVEHVTLPEGSSSVLYVLLLHSVHIASLRHEPDISREAEA